MRFLLNMLWLAYIPDWMRDQQPDNQHFYRRQFTKKYQRKCAIVRRLWVCSGLLILFFPTIPFAAVISLLSTFLSFCLLDESR
ncbi:hypothetical protein [Neptunomonas sp.]|uniref:hypothetical protein n=1 Tax=Neptunomonas sp. TaxID=1971898 RepID=UPI003563C002